MTKTSGHTDALAGQEAPAVEPAEVRGRGRLEGEDHEPFLHPFQSLDQQRPAVAVLLGPYVAGSGRRPLHGVGEADAMIDGRVVLPAPIVCPEQPAARGRP